MGKLRDAAFNKTEYEYFKNVIANYQKPKKLKPDRIHRKLITSRCPGCGGMVVMPCVACQPDFMILAAHRATGQGRDFSSLLDLADNIKTYTAGPDIDALAQQLIGESDGTRLL